MKNPKRLLAIAAIILLLSMYLVLFVSALGKNEGSAAVFRGMLAMVIAVPVLLYAFLLVARVIRPSKSALIDAVIFAGSAGDAADPAVSGHIASLRLKGYSTYIRPEAGIDEIRSLIREDGLSNARTFVITGTEENAKKARDAGFPSAVYRDIEHLKEQMKAVGIR